LSIEIKSKPWFFLAAAAAAISYWIAFSTSYTGGAILLSLPCLFYLARLPTPRQAFYVGLLTGIAMYAPPLMFFFQVFGRAAGAIDLIAGLPIGIFVLLLHLARQRIPNRYLIWLTPMLWTGIEYFRSELYTLRFAWLLPGQAVAFLPGVRLLWIGVYGIGFVMALTAALLVDRRRLTRLFGLLATVGLATLIYWPASSPTPTSANLHVAGIQLEFPTSAVAADSLKRLAIAHPEAQLLVLSEYSFDGPVPEIVRQVCRQYHRYLVAGGTRPLADGAYYDTAFVVGPNGKDVFQQIKSVPVQFMADGLPAEHRRVWNSPWGKIGIAVCYDLSYAGVMDDFVRQGATGLIIPTEDSRGWGNMNAGCFTVEWRPRDPPSTAFPPSASGVPAFRN
jgi:apolipoprotein N-acyltransferase